MRSDRSEYLKRYHAEHRERNLQHQAEYRRKNREAIRERAATPERRAAARARASAWYYANRERAIARISTYLEAHPAKARRWHENYEMSVALPCPFCHRKMRDESKSCEACQKAYGHLCKHNPLCAVKGRHKHCPACSFPVMNPQQLRTVELCRHCIEDTKRGAYMRATDNTAELEAA